MKPTSESGGVPAQSLELLRKTACGDTGGSQAARSFLFWLAGQTDPTGYRGDGGIEIRRFDERHRRAALEVISWWTGSRESDQPLYDVLDALLEKFRGSENDQKVLSALDKLERAQRLVNDAGEDLCSVESYSDEWSDITSLHGTVKDHWHSVNKRREELQRQVDAQ